MKITMDDVAKYYNEMEREDLCDYCGCKYFINFDVDKDCGGRLKEIADRYEYVRDRTYQRVDFYCYKLDKSLDECVKHCESYESEIKE